MKNRFSRSKKDLGVAGAGGVEGVTGLPFPSVGSGPNAPRGAAYIPPRACVVMDGGAAGDSRFHLLKNGYICECGVLHQFSLAINS